MNLRQIFFQRFGCTFFPLLLLTSFIPTSCNHSNNAFFEGTVTYEIEYTPLRKEFTIAKMNILFGSRLTLTIKNGHMLKHYLDYRGNILQTRIFDPNTYLNSQYFHNSDTVYIEHTDKNPFKTIGFIHLPDTTIDGKTLEGIKTVITDTNNELAIPVNFWYYFDTTLKADPKDFARFCEGEWNKIIQEKKSIATFYGFNSGNNYLVSYKEIKIEHHSVDPKIFEVPKGLVPKYID